MIFTHPVLFNIIVVLFIAFTSGWLVYVLATRHAAQLRRKMTALEKEKENLQRHTQQLEAQLQQPYDLNKTPVISLSTAVKLNKTNDLGL